MYKRVEGRVHKVHSFTNSGNLSVSAYGSTNGANSASSLIAGVVGEDNTTLQNIYKDIYTYDNLCGSAIDLKATMLSSGFNLTGCDDKRLEVYLEACNRLRLPADLAGIAIEYYTTGKFISTLILSESGKMFVDRFDNPAVDCEIKRSPFVNIPPIIKYTPSDWVKSFVGDNNKFSQKSLSSYSANIIDSIKGGSIDLDPLATLFVHRPALITDTIGESILRRIVPIYIMEKLLYKGTISEAARRQRSIMHIQAGSDTWRPTTSDLQSLVGLFQEADLDPVNAMIATRNDIQVNEVRQGGDFWKYTDSVDQTASMKMRILGISESFLSGESSYNAMEVALSVLIENMRADRDYMTQALFYEKLFPLVAELNRFTKDNKNAKDVTSASLDLNLELKDRSRYDMPTIKWTKSLRPEADREFIDMLATLEEKGVPVNIAMYASAGGITMQELEDSWSSDIQIRKKAKEYEDKLKKEGIENKSEGEDAYASVLAATQGSLQRPRLARLAELDNEYYYENGVKKHLSKSNRKRLLDRAIKARLNISDRHTYNTRVKQAKKGGLL